MQRIQKRQEPPFTLDDANENTAQVTDYQPDFDRETTKLNQQ